MFVTEKPATTAPRNRWLTVAAAAIIAAMAALTLQAVRSGPALVPAQSEPPVAGIASAEAFAAALREALETAAETADDQPTQTWGEHFATLKSSGVLTYDFVVLEQPSANGTTFTVVSPAGDKACVVFSASSPPATAEIETADGRC